MVPDSKDLKHVGIMFRSYCDILLNYGREWTFLIFRYMNEEITIGAGEVNNGKKKLRSLV